MAGVWSDDPNGGPNNSIIVSVYVNKINRVLKDYGLKIVGHKAYGYRIREL